eukprot:6129687-Prymnesium_polylepis.1
MRPVLWPTRAHGALEGLPQPLPARTIHGGRATNTPHTHSSQLALPARLRLHSPARTTWGS